MERALIFILALILVTWFIVEMIFRRIRKKQQKKIDEILRPKPKAKDQLMEFQKKQSELGYKVNINDTLI